MRSMIKQVHLTSLIPSLDMDEKVAFGGVEQKLTQLTEGAEGGIVLFAVDYKSLRTRVGAGKPFALDIGDVIDKLTPDVEPRVVGVEALLQARRNATLRTEVLTGLDHLTSGQVSELAGSRATNRSALAHRWRSEGRIFGVTWRDQWLFPRFQFDEETGKPRREIEAVIAPFREHDASNWEVAEWWVGQDPWLRARPIDVLDESPDRVADAAQRAYATPT
jgi:hypothetical protein